jgi:hypothetical protein
VTNINASGGRSGWGIDQRIGRRTPLRGVGITWTIPGEKPTLLRKKRIYRGELADLSVTGASMVAKRNTNLDRGMTIELSIGEARAYAVVRHVNDLADDDLAVHGLFFTQVNDAMSLMLERLGGKPGGGYGTSWGRPAASEA